mgnify:FL=1|jgi:hypothetical protein
MRNILSITILVIMFSSFSFAQWNNDPAQNTIVADTTGSQIMPKAVKCKDGSSYVSWFDTRGGSYYLYMQKMSAKGVREWGNNGILVSDKPQNSFLADYALECDKTNNAIVAFTDVRAGSQNVVAYKISPKGKFLWGNDGIMVSDGKGTAVNPSIAVTKDGNYVIAWIISGEPDKIGLQKISVEGTNMWGKTAIQYGSTNGEGFIHPKLVPSDKGTVILLHTVTTGKFPAQKVKIAAQKFNTKGEITWGSGGKWIQDIGNVMIYTPPFFESDGKDGALLAWHDDRNSTNIQSAWVQRINSKGDIAFPKNGSEVAIQNNLNKFNPVASVLSESNEVVVTWRMTTSGQGESGLYSQKFNSKGKRMWGDEGLELIPVSSIKVNGYKMLSLAKEVVIGYIEENTTGLNGTVKAMVIPGNGKMKKKDATFMVSSVNSQKSDLSMSRGTDGSVIAIWADSRKDENGIYGQRISIK